MKPTPNGSEAVEVQEDVERGGFCFVARPDPATLVFIACSQCAVVLSLADTVRSTSGHPVCWDCGVLSLHA